MVTLAHHLYFSLLLDRKTRSASAVASRASAIQLGMASDRAAIEALGAEWTALYAACGKPHQVFQQFEWLAIWASVYAGRRLRPAIVTGRIDGRLVLVWPLVVRNAFGIRVLSTMGEPFSQYSDALIADDLGDTDLDRVFDYVMALPVDVMALRRVREDAALAPLLRRRLGVPQNCDVAPFIDFSGVPDAAAFERRFPGKLRSSRRRRRRRLEDRGPVTFETLAPSPEAAAHVATALAFKRGWASDAGVPALAVRDPRFERVFIAAARAGDKASGLRVSVLRCAGEIVGIALSVAGKDRLFGHVLAPCPGLDHLGLGGLLAERIITGALGDGFVAIDLLAPADPYKLEWTSDAVGVGDYAVGRTAIGHAYTRLWIRYGRAAAKRAAHRFGCRRGLRSTKPIAKFGDRTPQD